MTLPSIDINLESDVPVYRQIADGVRAALAEGELGPGVRLPATRDLARQLGVNRNTVVAAYDLLAGEGVVRSHTGRGTFVAEPSSPERPSVPDADVSWQSAFSEAVEGPTVGRLLSAYRLATAAEGIPFAAGFAAADMLPVEAFGEALDEVLRSRGARLLTYGPVAGSAGLRRHIADEMTERGGRVGAEQLLITNGSQQALELVFRTLVDRGDPVVVEDPTFTGALSALGSLGARLVGVPQDSEGIRPDLLTLALERHRPRLIYLQPTFHNPTTRVMSERRRREVLAIAARFGCGILEDDWAGDLRLEGRDLPTLHALDGGRRVIYVSTFSKKLMPGLRVGWVAAPRPVRERLIALKQIEDCGTSPLIQEALHRFLQDGGLRDHLTRVLPVYRGRRDRMLRAIADHFPATAHTERPEGGLFLWVRLPAEIDTNELFLHARHRGVLFSRGELFHVDGSGRDAMRLTYGGATDEQIDRGIATLGEFIRERLEGGEPSPVDERQAEATPIF